MSVGFFAVDRGIFDHESFEPEPFTQREAWLWLIAEAAWRSCRVRVGRHRIELRRGQCVHSVRFMAVAWQWHRSKVERFLTHLKTEMMIETHTETGITVITVYNYDKFQRVAPPSETVADTQSETAARQRRSRSACGSAAGAGRTCRVLRPDLGALRDLAAAPAGPAEERKGTAEDLVGLEGTLCPGPYEDLRTIDPKKLKARQYWMTFNERWSLR